MADGALTIELEGELADQVREAAAVRGLTPEDYARQVLAFGVGDEDDDVDWETDDLRRLEEPGEDTDASVVFAELRDDMEKARRAKP